MKKILFIFCAIALLASCKTTKKTPKNGGDDPVIETVTNAEKTVYESVVAKNFDFDNITAKAKYSVGSSSLSGKFFVEHGKRLAMTMTVLGIEVVRIEANNEAITMVNKLDKIYTRLSIDEFAEKFGMKDEMRYDALESVLLGRMFIPGVGEAKAKDLRSFNLSLDDAGTLIARTKLNNDKYHLCYYSSPEADATLAKTEVIVKKGETEKSICCDYESYIELGGGEIPTSSTLTLSLSEEKLAAKISLINPTINGKPMSAFKPTEAYRQVSIQEFIEAIKNLKK